MWFGNVERVASERIGRETVTYVSNIYKYYITYRLLTEQQERRDAAPRDLVDELDRDAEAIPVKSVNGRAWQDVNRSTPKDSRNERPPSVVHSGKEECHDAQPP